MSHISDPEPVEPSPSRLPQRKVGVAGLAGAVSVLAIWGAQQAGMDIPPEVSSAFTTVVTFVTGYFVKQ